MVSLITIIVAVPLGMFSAIYLNEYAHREKPVCLIRLSIRNLSGVPSVVYGLFGVALFVRLFHFGASILSSGMTLGLLTLPWTITASEEALKTVPKSFRDGALAQGATQWQAIRTNVLPYAIPGMLPGPYSDWPGLPERRLPFYLPGRPFPFRLFPNPFLTSLWPCPTIFIF